MMYSWALQFIPIFQFALLFFKECVDFGKLAVTEGDSSHFGLGLPQIFFFNCTAILWHYLANCLSQIAGQNVSEVCSEQYSRAYCILIGTAVKLSVIASDLTKILSIAHGFSMLLELNLFSSTILASIVADAPPVVFLILGSYNLKVLHFGIPIFTSFFYVLGLLFSQLESLNIRHDTLILNLKNACTAMVLLGAHVMPHNYFLPCTIQQQEGILNANVNAMIHTQHIAILSIFTFIFLVNSAMMNITASVFNNYDFYAPSFHDGLLLTSQIFRSSAVTIMYCLLFFFLSIIVAITHGHVGPAIAHIPNLSFWDYQIIANVLALYHTQGTGSEGIYELLLFCQITSAILLLASAVPLFQIPSFQLLSSSFRDSPLVLFLGVIAFIVIFAANAIFIIEMIFDSNEWLIDLMVNVGNDFTLIYHLTALFFLASSFLSLYLLFTRLRSENEPYLKMCTLGLQEEQTKQLELVKDNFSVEALDNKNQDSPCDLSLIKPEETFDSTNKENIIHKKDVILEDDETICSSEPLGASHALDPKSSTESLNNASGLTRGEKRQLASILDEFWGLLFDHHGNLTNEAMNIGAAVLFDLAIEFPPCAKLQITPQKGLVADMQDSESVSLSKYYENNDSKDVNIIMGYETNWTKNYVIPFLSSAREDKAVYNPSVSLTWGGKSIYSISGAPIKRLKHEALERLVLQSLRFCVRKLLKLNGSDWLFCQNGGSDEKLIDYLAMSEKLLDKDEASDLDDESILYLPNISYCGKECIWQGSLVLSFAVWSIRLMFELASKESRPELWGKYTFVLNRLQGLLDPTFCKPREILPPCKCLQASGYNMDSSGTTQVTCKKSILELIKEVEASLSTCRGRAGNIAFPKGKENLTSVFRRYKHRLSK